MESQLSTQEQNHIFPFYLDLKGICLNFLTSPRYALLLAARRIYKILKVDLDMYTLSEMILRRAIVLGVVDGNGSA